MGTRVALVAVALTCLLWTGKLQASDQFMVTGVGQFSCGKWSQNKSTRPAGSYVSGNNLAAAMDTQWVLGFISAFNLYGNGSGDVTQGTDTDGALAWIDNYCAAQPLDNIVKAAMALVAELSKG